MDLVPEHVQAWAQSLGLDLSGDDLTEVTYRLNGLLDALAPLGGLPLDTVEPGPWTPDPEGRW